MGGNNKTGLRAKSVECREALLSPNVLVGDPGVLLGKILTVIISLFCFLISLNSFAQIQPQVMPSHPQNQQQQQSNGDTLSGINMESFGQEAEGKMVWRENPFIQPANDLAVSDLILTGIVYGENKSAAIVNDEIIEVGDRVGMSEVLAIEKNRIILRNENGIFSLSFGSQK